jgi:hypothetical protein
MVVLASAAPWKSSRPLVRIERFKPVVCIINEAFFVNLFVSVILEWKGRAASVYGG